MSRKERKEAAERHADTARRLANALDVTRRMYMAGRPGTEHIPVSVLVEAIRGVMPRSNLRNDRRPA